MDKQKSIALKCLILYFMGWAMLAIGLIDLLGRPGFEIATGVVLLLLCFLYDVELTMRRFHDGFAE